MTVGSGENCCKKPYVLKVQVSLVWPKYSSVLVPVFIERRAFQADWPGLVLAWSGPQSRCSQREKLNKKPFKYIVRMVA